MLNLHTTTEDIIKFGNTIKYKKVDLFTTQKIISPSEEAQVQRDSNELIDDAVIFYDGWYNVEQDDETTYRWSTGTAFLNLTGYKNKLLNFVLTSNYPIPEQEHGIWVANYVEKQVIGRIVLSSTQNSKNIELVIESDNVVLSLHNECIWTPAIYDESSNDWRELGVRLSNLVIS